MNRDVRNVATWLRGRAKAFDNDIAYLERQSPPLKDEQQAMWRASRDRIRAYRIIASELNTAADAVERGE